MPKYKNIATKLVLMEKIFRPHCAVLFAVFSVFSAAFTAQAGNWADEVNRDTAWTPSFASGATNAIATPQQLAQFAHILNSGTEFNSITFAGVTVIVTNSLDLSSHDWTSAGDWYNRFCGVFTAAPGVIIKGMTITAANTIDVGWGFAGLFGFIGEGGFVDGITLVNTRINISNHREVHIGAIAGFNGNGTIVNCQNDGDIFGYSDRAAIIGGIVGVNERGFIGNCVSRGSVIGTVEPIRQIYNTDVYVGGISGHDLGALVNCVNYAAVSGSDEDYHGFIGGITGFSYDAFLANCVNHGAVTSETFADVGTIAGVVTGDNPVNCYWNNTVEGMPAEAIGNSFTSPAGCVPFGAAPGILRESVTIGGITTNDLLVALNAWVGDNTPPANIKYTAWNLSGSPDGYPWFGSGGDKQFGVRITAIRVIEGADETKGVIELEFAAPAALFGRVALDDAAGWVYLRNVEGLSTTIPITDGYHFFTARNIK